MYYYLRLNSYFSIPFASLSSWQYTVMRKPLLAAICCLIVVINAHAKNLLKYADPFVGTGGHGHTYPGATVPFGMVQVSPDNGTQGWDWCSGYNHADSTIAGFSHMHLSGTGVGDWCDISVMPNNGLFPEGNYDYRVKFDHKNEVASPGYYSVKMNNGVKVSLTATERVGFHKYEFPKGGMQVVRFNLGFCINYDSTVATYIKKLNDSTIVGYRFSDGWAHVQKVYFAARTSAAFTKFYLRDSAKLTGNSELKGQYVNGQLVFNTANGTVLMKVALSTVSTDKALIALGEIKGWDFDAVRKSAEHKWEEELDKIAVKTSDDNLKRIFYSALYHTCMAPVVYSDADGEYQNAKGEVLKMKKGQRYTVFSLWDTFRALNPLFTLTQTERNTDILNSMLAFYDENGELPVWDLSTYETGCMSGYHCVPVLADAVMKNTEGLDAERVYTALKSSAFQTIRGTPNYIKYGYLPQDKEPYSVTITLEYAYDDWCIAQVAKKLGKTDDYNMFMKRAQAYKLLFDKNMNFIRAKNADGSWTEPFDPYVTSTNWKDAMFMEGNSWQYTFFVPHDIRGLAAEFGTTDKFIKKLDSLFTISSQVKGESAPPDVSGLVGQYAHGNEPSHHIAYMYDFVGEPWKTQEKVRFIVDSMYHAAPDGYAGNEDCGQMSAWAIWSMVGMYPANPANGQYVFGSPMFDEVRIKVPANKEFVIKAKNNSKSNCYIQSVTLNGKPYSKVYIDHAVLMKGGVLEFVMGAMPNKKWGVNKVDWPASVN